MRKFTCYFVLILVIISFSACRVSVNLHDFEKSIEHINEQLPVRKSQVLFVNMKQDADFFELKLIHDHFDDVYTNPDYLKMWGLYSFLPDVFFSADDEWVKTVRNQGRGFRLIFCSPDDNQRVTIELSDADIMKALSKMDDVHEWNRLLLHLEADYNSMIKLPMQGDTRCLQVFFDDTTFTYVYGLYNYDTSMADPAFRDEQTNNIRSYLSSAYRTATDKAIVAFTERLYTNEVTLLYKYYSPLGDSIIVKFTPYEIGEIIRQRE